MNLADIDWKGGEVTYWNLDEFDELTSIETQVELLCEDLAQIEYPNQWRIDVGWYPEFSPEGSFAISLIHKDNWDAPYFYARFADPSILKRALELSIVIMLSKNQQNYN